MEKCDLVARLLYLLACWFAPSHRQTVTKSRGKLNMSISPAATRSTAVAAVVVVAEMALISRLHTHSTTPLVATYTQRDTCTHTGSQCYQTVSLPGQVTP